MYLFSLVGYKLNNSNQTFNNPVKFYQIQIPKIKSQVTSKKQSDGMKWRSSASPKAW